MYARHKPTHINFCASIEAFHAGNIERIPIHEAEEKVAAWRNVPTFNWIEDFSEQIVSDVDRQQYAGSIVNPDDLALCHFGADVGYAPIALKPIPQGKSLVFTGDFVSELKLDDVHPYRVPRKIGNYISAKHSGGFASMFMDFPTSEQIKKFENRVKKLKLNPVTLQQKNIGYVHVKLSTHEAIVCYTTLEDLQPGTILGSSYIARTRLLYKEFIGFDVQGKRLAPELSRILNEIIYKNIIKSDLSHSDIQLYEVLQQIQRGKYVKAMLSIIGNSSLLNELTDEEVLILKKNLSAENVKFLEELSLHFSRKHLSVRRSMVELLNRMAIAEVKYRQSMPVCLDATSNYCHVLYPNCEYDMLQLAHYLSELNYPIERRLQTYGTARFFAAKKGNKQLDQFVPSFGDKTKSMP